MTIETDIKAALDAHSGLSAIISARTYASRFPQNPTLPAVSYYINANNAINTMDSKHKDNKLIRFDIIGSSYSSIRQVAVQLKDAMETASTYKSVFLNENDLDFDIDQGIYRTVLEFSTW